MLKIKESYVVLFQPFIDKYRIKIFGKFTVISKSCETNCCVSFIILDECTQLKFMLYCEFALLLRTTLRAHKIMFKYVLVNFKCMYI